MIFISYSRGLFGFLFFLGITVAGLESQSFAVEINLVNSRFSFYFDIPKVGDSASFDPVKFQKAFKDDLSLSNLRKGNDGFEILSDLLRREGGEGFRFSSVTVRVADNSDPARREWMLISDAIFLLGDSLLAPASASAPMDRKWMEKFYGGLTDFAVAAQYRTKQELLKNNSIEYQYVVVQVLQSAMGRPGVWLREVLFRPDKVYEFLVKKFENNSRRDGWKSSYSDFANFFKILKQMNESFRGTGSDLAKALQDSLDTLSWLMAIPLENSKERIAFREAVSPQGGSSPEQCSEVSAALQSAETKLKLAKDLATQLLQKEKSAAAPVASVLEAEAGDGRRGRWRGAGAGPVAVAEDGPELNCDALLSIESDWTGKAEFKVELKRFCAELKELTKGRRESDKTSLSCHKKQFKNYKTVMRDKLVAALEPEVDRSYPVSAPDAAAAGGASSEAGLSGLLQLIEGARGFLKIARGDDSEPAEGFHAGAAVQIATRVAQALQGLGEELGNAVAVMRSLDGSPVSSAGKSSSDDDWTAWRDSVVAQWNSLPKAWSDRLLKVEKYREIHHRLFPQVGLPLVQTQSGEAQLQAAAGAGEWLSELSEVQKVAAQIAAGNVSVWNFSGDLLSQISGSDPEHWGELFAVVKTVRQGKGGSLPEPRLLKDLWPVVFPQGHASLLDQWNSDGMDGVPLALEVIESLSEKYKNRLLAQKVVISFIMLSKHADFKDLGAKLLETLEAAGSKSQGGAGSGGSPDGIASGGARSAKPSASPFGSGNGEARTPEIADQEVVFQAQWRNVMDDRLLREFIKGILAANGADAVGAVFKNDYSLLLLRLERLADIAPDLFKFSSENGRFKLMNRSNETTVGTHSTHAKWASEGTIAPGFLNELKEFFVAASEVLH